MSEPTSGGVGEATTAGAGALLRAARERQGLHIAALAAAIKIPARKLEALEADRFDELPDAAFARALAMTVCRALKIDAAPVLAQLPRLHSVAGMPDVAGGLNAPFRERAGHADPAERGLGRHPLVWAAFLVLVAAAVLFVLPTGWWQSLWPQTAQPSLAPMPQDATSGMAAASSANQTEAPATMPAAEPPVASVSLATGQAASTAAVEVVHSAPAAETGASAGEAAPERAVTLRASEASWVEVIDAGNQVLVRRVLQPGESLHLDGELPLRLRIGNAAATQLQFRGQPVDLGPSTRDNIARLELR